MRMCLDCICLINEFATASIASTCICSGGASMCWCLRMHLLATTAEWIPLQVHQLHQSFSCNGNALMCWCLQLYLLALASSLQLNLITSMHAQLQHLQLMMFHTLQLQQPCMSTLSKQCMCALFQILFHCCSYAACVDSLLLSPENCKILQQTSKHMNTSTAAMHSWWLATWQCLCTCNCCSNPALATTIAAPLFQLCQQFKYAKAFAVLQMQSN